ncbi:MAG TPA: hypothetical protein VGJ00_03335 [Rhabdochlamydiaceae bacterium]
MGVNAALKTLRDEIQPAQRLLAQWMGLFSEKRLFNRELVVPESLT